MPEGPRGQPPWCCSCNPCVEGRPAGGVACRLSTPWKETKRSETAGKHRGKPEMWETTGKIKSAPIHSPFDAVGRCIAEASDIIIVTVYRAGGGKHQAVTRETGDPQDHHLLPQTTVDLERRGDEENNNIIWEHTLHNLLLEITCIYWKISAFSLRMGTKGMRQIW